MAAHALGSVGGSVQHCRPRAKEQGVVTPIVRVGPFANGVKMQSRGQAGFLALVKRSRGLSGSVNGQDQLSPKPIPTRIPILQATRTILSTLFISAG